MSNRQSYKPAPPITVPAFPPPHLLLWPGYEKETPIRRLRNAYRTCWRRRANTSDNFKTLLCCLAWPLIAVVLSLQSTLRYGRSSKAGGGPGRFRQWSMQAYLAIFHRVVPKNYYVFELQRPAFRHRAAEYVTRVETKGGIYRALKPRDNPDQVIRIKDKVVFATFFGRNGLPVVPVFAAFRGGVCLPQIGPEVLPVDCDLFTKPIEGRGGGGASIWRVQSPAQYRGSRGEQLSLDQLLEHLAACSTDRACLLQPRRINHPAIRDLTPGALATVRILSVLDERMEPEPVNAAFRMPISKLSPVDNFHAGGIAAAVNMETGALGRASSLGLTGDFAWHETHPSTGGRILGRRLPDWEAAKALVVAAHRLIAPRIVVGWDIALIPEGPVLVEGNGGPDVDIHQRVERAPMGNARFGELLAFHMERLLKP
jgi:hypothetical protein